MHPQEPNHFHGRDAGVSCQIPWGPGGTLHCHRSQEVSTTAHKGPGGQGDLEVFDASPSDQACTQPHPSSHTSLHTQPADPRTHVYLLHMQPPVNQLLCVRM